jgi:hypothetical protein
VGEDRAFEISVLVGDDRSSGMGAIDDIRTSEPLRIVTRRRGGSMTIPESIAVIAATADA